MADGSGGRTADLRSRGLTVRAVREESRQADFVASTAAVDSYDEIVEQIWQLDRYLTNPVVLYAHDKWDLPIGVCTDVAVRNGQLECTIRFATAEENPKADQVWRMVQSKTLRAVSVGFWPNDMRWELRDGKEIFVLSDNELFEISIVPIPANPEALAKAKAAAPRARIPAPHGAPNQEPPTKGAPTQENAMTEKELRDALDKSEKALIDARASEKNATDKLHAAEAEVRKLESKSKDVEAENTVLLSQNAALETERNATKERAEKAESGLIEAEVSALVGKKISAAEKDDFVELRRTNQALFAKMVAQRSDMKLEDRVIPTEAKSGGTHPVALEAGNSDVRDEIEKLGAA